MEDILKQLYGDAVTEESLAKFREDLGKKFVPKADFNQRGEELRELREKLAELEAATAKVTVLEEEKQALLEELSLVKEKHEQDLAAAKQKEEDILLSHAIDNALKDAKARCLPAVMALINRDEIVWENGTVVGLSEQIAALKQEHGYLFEAGEDNLQFIRPAEGSAALSSEEFQKLGYMDRLKLKKEQPGLYQTLTKKQWR